MGLRWNDLASNLFTCSFSIYIYIYIYRKRALYIYIYRKELSHSCDAKELEIPKKRKSEVSVGKDNV